MKVTVLFVCTGLCYAGIFTNRVENYRAMMMPPALLRGANGGSHLQMVASAGAICTHANMHS